MSEAPSASGPASPTPAPGGDKGGDSQSQAGRPDAPAGQVLDTAEPDGSGQAEGLPGVVRTRETSKADSDLEKELFGEPKVEDEEGEGRDPKARPRGPDGRFLKGEAAEPQPEGQKPQVPAAEPDSGAQFEFAGRKWKSQQEADQAVRSGLGMIKPLTQQRDENWNAYKQWEGYAGTLEQRLNQANARIAELEGGSPQHGSGNAKDQKTGSGDLAIDWDAYQYIAEKGSLAQAGQYLIEQVNAHYRDTVIPSQLEQLRAEFNQRLAPMTAETEMRQTAEAMTQSTMQLGALKTPDGRMAFPELHDPEKVERIGMLWAREAQDERDLQRRQDMLQTPAGLMQAVALYRLITSLESGPDVSTAQTLRAPEGLPDEPVAPGAAATVVDGGRDRMVHSQPANMSSAEAALVAEMDRGPMIDPDLGFIINRR